VPTERIELPTFGLQTAARIVADGEAQNSGTENGAYPVLALSDVSKAEPAIGLSA
jgi:hypothetical protein